MMEENELIEKVHGYTLYLSDDYLDEVIENQLFKNMKTIAFINFAKKCFMILHVTDEGTL